MANKNLFYSLYSTSNDTIQTNYKCSNLVDENDTSFDISGNNGVITDSNGNTLASIDMSLIHEAGITQYNVETRIIQPYSCYVLQGQEYGYANTSYFYKIHEKASSITGYEYYCNISFDLYYDNIQGKGLHVDIQANTIDTLTDLINTEFEQNNVFITTAIQVMPNPETNTNEDYLVFTSQKETFFYYVKNVAIEIVKASEDYPNSPFSDNTDDMLPVIYDYILMHHPILPGTRYDEDTYAPDCLLYEWLITNYEKAIEELYFFKKALILLDKITSYTEEAAVNTIIAGANFLLSTTVYNNEVIERYDDNNMYAIMLIIEDLQKYINDNILPTKIWLKEDIKRRIPIMKYPNGAFRGIVLIVDPPVNGEVVNTQVESLWIHHIKDFANIYIPAKSESSKKNSQILYNKKTVGVLANATLISEQNNCQSPNSCICCNGIQTNDVLTSTLTDGYEDSSDCDFIELPDDTCSNSCCNETDDVIFMGRSYYSSKEDVIGLYRYLQHLSENRLWDRCNGGYMIIGKEDNPNEKAKNLPTSMLIYNPNDIPIRLKYLIFS